MDFSKIDQNFAAPSRVNIAGLRWFEVPGDAFRVFGVLTPTKELPHWHRMPPETAKATSDAVANLNLHTSGGRVRFSSASRYVAVHAEYDYEYGYGNICVDGSHGMDLWGDKVLPDDPSHESYLGTFTLTPKASDGYEAVVKLGDTAENVSRTFTVCLPPYCRLDKLYIGVDESCGVSLPERRYKEGNPMVFYGSSITQGGCPSHPGNAYEAILSRALDRDYVNLGFSGSAKGEAPMAEYIASLPMSVFVLDYDHNAPTAEHLLATHEFFFRTVREKNPFLPIVCVSRPCHFDTPDTQRRRAVIRATVENALAAGDKNVYFIDGGTFFSAFGKEYADLCTVDGVHPNDLGFAGMAKVMLPVLRKIFGE